MSHRAISISGGRPVRKDQPDRPCDDKGIALIIVLLTMMLLSALGMALSLTMSTEMRIAATYRWTAETFYAAEAGVERSIQELSTEDDWTEVLGGTVMSTFVDGPPGSRLLPDGSRLDLNEA